jgi:hypothetical protein
MPSTGVRLSVVPGSAAVVSGAVLSSVPASRLSALMSDDLPAFCAPTTHRSPWMPTCEASPLCLMVMPGCDAQRPHLRRHAVARCTMQVQAAFMTGAACDTSQMCVWQWCGQEARLLDELRHEAGDADVAHAAHEVHLRRRRQARLADARAQRVLQPGVVGRARQRVDLVDRQDQLEGQPVHGVGLPRLWQQRLHCRPASCVRSSSTPSTYHLHHQMQTSELAMQASAAHAPPVRQTLALHVRRQPRARTSAASRQSPQRRRRRAAPRAARSAA